jgi:Family of unknown function (DUF6464)
MQLMNARVFLSDTSQCVGEVLTLPTHQPGTLVEVDGSVYSVLERRHQYSLRSGRYRLDRIVLYVRLAEGITSEHIYWQRKEGVIGDPQCIFNAHSPLIRCAPQPSGPCQGCKFFESQP